MDNRSNGAEPEKTGKIRIVVADDQSLFARMLKTVLELRWDSFEVIGIASNGKEAVELVAALEPDILLLDLRMPVLDGIGAIRELDKAGSTVKIIVLTTFDDDSAVQQAVGAGVAGYILKDCAPDELFSAIHAVHSGANTYSPGVIRRLTDQRAGTPPETAGPESRLNRRELEILALIAQGLGNKEIAGRLFIAEQTVKNNISSLYEKLGVKDRPKLIKLAESRIEENGPHRY